MLLAALPLCAVEQAPRRGDRVAVLTSPVGGGALRVDARIRTALPKYLASALKKSGYDARVTPMTLMELQDRSDRESGRDDYYLEVMYADTDGQSWGGVDTGTVIGSTGVGAEISVIEAHVVAEIRVYDGATLEMIDSFTLEASAVAPAITGVGVGDRHGYLFFSLPILAPRPYHTAARRIADAAATRLGKVPESDAEIEVEAEREPENGE